jgi:formylglycine-generating enzyme required for sulfatase activity
MRAPLVRSIVIVLLCLAFAAPASARAERRVALVIGNGAYKQSPLKNPVNDARDMAATLRDLGFEVILRENADLPRMEAAVNEFWQRLKQGGAGLFYFAGHGLQVSGHNYLVPVGAKLEVEQDAKFKCLDAGMVLGRMENAGNGLNIIILDACRNNPFARSWRSAEVGLARMDAPKGSIIAYATAPDSVAADGEGRNGLYTEKLLRAMRAPGQPVEQVFKHVRDEVMRATKDRQVPWESTSLRGDFYFASPAKGGPQPAPRPQQLALAPAPTQAPQPAEAHKVSDAWTDPVTGMAFVWVPGGSFEMGCGSWAGSTMLFGDCQNSELPVRTVRLAGFWLGKFEVTQGQWRQVMGSNPSYFKNGDNYPVDTVSWLDVKEFLRRLNAQGAARFRLPTEAEWEYAARSGGKPEKYAGGDDLDRVAWYDGNSGKTSHPVGTKAPNGLGLYDMSGNVWEWCEDEFAASYPASAQDNPVVTGSGLGRVFRGGSWLYYPSRLRTGSRFYGPPGEGFTDRGFRVVRIPD